MAVLLFWAVALQAQEREQHLDRTPAIATSGDVEIESIRIVRAKASDAAKEADLTTMEIQLWLAATADKRPDETLLKVEDLGPIEDDTGKLLSTKKRLDRLAFLHGEVGGTQYNTMRGKAGPVISLVLEVPARQATTIRSIKGKAVVSPSTSSRLEFKDLSAISGKPLDHPKLKNLSIQPTIEVKKGETVLTLRVPVQHERLKLWGLVKDGEMPQPESESSMEGGTVLTATYRGDLSKESSLGIVIAEPGSPKVMEFNFKNVELP